MEKQIELLPFLRGIVEQTTTHFSEDFKIDAIRLGEAAFRSEPEDRTFLWMARPLGTQLVFERNAFLKETDDYIVWTHYADMPNGIQAYRVVVQGGNRDAPLGTVRKLNYLEQVKRVIANALHAERIEFTYPSGEMREVAVEKYRQEREWLFYEYGMPSRTRYCPYDENELQHVLAAEQLCQKKRQRKTTKKLPKNPTRE